MINRRRALGRMSAFLDVLTMQPTVYRQAMRRDAVDRGSLAAVRDRNSTQSGFDVTECGAVVTIASQRNISTDLTGDPFPDRRGAAH